MRFVQIDIHIPWRRKVLLGIPGILVCIYAIAVLLYVYFQPDIGLRTAFDTTVKGFDGYCHGTRSWPDARLEENDRICRLGGNTTQTWPQLLQAIHALGLPRPVESFAEAESFVPSLHYIEVDGDHFVRVEFERAPRGGGKVAVLSTWCRVGDLPSREWIASVLWFFLKLSLFIVGALVFWKRPTDPFANQFFLLCIVTLGAYMGGYHWSRIAGQPLLIMVFMVCSVLLPPALLHFYALFPRPKLFLQLHPRWSLLLIYGFPGLFLVTLAATYFWVLWQARHGVSDADVNTTMTLLRNEIYAYLGVAALWYLASVGCLMHSYRTVTDVTERNQVKWIMFASLVALALILYSLYLAALKPNAFSAGKATWPMFGASICFTAAFILSITRYRLMQLDQILTSGVVYFLISFAVGLVYYAVLFVGWLIVGSQSGPPLFEVLPVSVTAWALMVVLDLARSRFKRALDRRFYREKYQLDRTLRRMGQAIEQLVDPHTLARQLLQTSAEVLSVSRGAIYLREGNPPIYRLVGALGAPPPLLELSPGCPIVEALLTRSRSVAQTGRSSQGDPVQRQLRFLGGEVAHALSHEGQLLALLILGAKDIGQYTMEDANLLAAFTQLTALALQSAERNRMIEGLNRELQTKVEKISEQQRRILALQSQLMRQTTVAKPAVEPPAAAPIGIIGSSVVVQQLLQFIKKVSASQSAVLIRGESGTGKELLARALHENSARTGKAFVKVHCAALSPGLLESELFGHVKGAFTGAHRDKVGRFELANGGTLFLDEIGDISLDVQTKLLRVLQEMTFERVGSSDPVEVDVRIIAATHQDLERFIAEGRFREDLYYRLNVISVAVPALRERREDIPELAAHFLKVHCQRSNRPLVQLDDDTLVVLKAHKWPGNVRQLENVLERAVVVAEGPVITVEDLPVEMMTTPGISGTVMAPAMANAEPEGGALTGILGERRQRARREREQLVRALAEAKGNKAEAARALGLARSTLVSRLKKHGLS
jgi:transcriptional regulator with GAF, ATPase, and Fis domain